MNKNNDMFSWSFSTTNTSGSWSCGNNSRCTVKPKIGDIVRYNRRIYLTGSSYVDMTSGLEYGTVVGIRPVLWFNVSTGSIGSTVTEDPERKMYDIKPCSDGPIISVYENDILGVEND